MATAEPQARLQSLSDQFQKHQQGTNSLTDYGKDNLANVFLELQDVVASRQRLEGQKQENVGVQKEFDALGEGETIYKLVGPILLKQDKFEAENTVKGRLDFITGEITRLEDQIKETQGKMEKTKSEIIQIQASAQQAAAGGSGKTPAQ